MELSVRGQVALITGGSRGIGAATVRMFVDCGARVLFSYEKAQPQAEKLVAELGADKCAAMQCSLSGTGTAQQLVAGAVKLFGRLDILVVNHGVWPSQDAPVDRLPDEQWRSTVAINLDSVFALVKHSVAQMKRQGEPGHIVLVSSTELACDGIRVNCVAPGWVMTDMSIPALDDPKTRETVLNKIPLGRVATPEEIAAPILFLCTEHAGFITGEIFNVNGGAVLVG